MADYRTIDEAWRTYATAGNNFDAIRFFAAAAVILSHSFEITGGLGAFEPLKALTGDTSFGHAAVLTFFVLSGFLITKSWKSEPQLLAFGAKRALRIFPALFAVVFISVFVIGPIWTSYSVAAYFGSVDTWAYLTNLGFYTKFDSLPGVFSATPLAENMNGPLWTLKFEVMCYLAIAGLGFAKVLTPRACIGVLAVSYVIAFLGDKENFGGAAFYLFGFADLARAFFVGAISALYADKIILRPGYAIVAAAGLCAAAALGGFAVLFPILGGYLVFYIGFAPLGRVARFGKYGDFSYGLYVWGFPIQQIVFTALGPGPWYMNFVLAFPITLGAAYLSWRLIEAPALSLKAMVVRSRDEKIPPATLGQRS